MRRYSVSPLLAALVGSIATPRSDFHSSRTMLAKREAWEAQAEKARVEAKRAEKARWWNQMAKRARKHQARLTSALRAEGVCGHPGLIHHCLWEPADESGVWWAQCGATVDSEDINSGAVFARNGDLEKYFYEVREWATKGWKTPGKFEPCTLCPDCCEKLSDCIAEGVIE